MQNLPWKKTTEVAIIIRSILKTNFKDYNFSVRSKSYAGGSSINISWTNGPTHKEVDSLVKHLQSVSHMDITDLVHHVPFCEHDGEKFNSMADHIFSNRHETVEFITPIAAEAAVKYGYTGKYEIVERNGIMSHIIVDSTWRFGRDTFDYLVYKIARGTSDVFKIDEIDISLEIDINDASLEELEAAGEIYDRTFRRWPPTFLV